jgi:hypothetical protein
MRLEKLLDRLAGQELSAAQVQAVRGLEVLERLGTVSARQVLAGLSRQQIDVWLQGEAQGVLERLARRERK